jgi:hypothetical protein
MRPPASSHLLTVPASLLPRVALAREPLLLAPLPLARIAEVTKLAVHTVLTAFLVDKGARLARTPAMQC